MLVVKLNQLIFLASTSSLLIGAVNVCQREPEEDNHVSSPNYPNEYDDDLDCTFIIHCPPKKLIQLKVLTFLTEETVDYLDVTLGEHPTFTLSGEYGDRNLGIHNVSKVKFFFHTDASGTHTGFDILYSFIPDPSIMILDNFNGIINPTLSSQNITFHKYQITKTNGWTRFVTLNLDTYKCPEDSTINIYVDMEPATNGCFDFYSSYHGFNITIELIFYKTTTNVEIQFKSVKRRWLKSCDPDFDCGNTFCVPLETKCDGFFDCPNDADEINCYETNADEQFVTENHSHTFLYILLILLIVVVLLFTFPKVKSTLIKKIDRLEVGVRYRNRETVVTDGDVI